MRKSLKVSSLTILSIFALSFGFPEMGHARTDNEEAAPVPKRQRPVTCEMILQRQDLIVNAAVKFHRAITGGEFTIDGAQMTNQRCAALDLDAICAADLPRLRMSVRENLRKAHPLAEQGDYILSFRLEGTSAPITEMSFDVPPVFAWSTALGTRPQVEAHLKKNQKVFQQVQPSSVELLPVGAHLKSRNKLSLYIATYEVTDDPSVVWAEIGTYLPCSSSQIDKETQSGLLRNEEGYLCRVPVLTFIRPLEAVQDRGLQRRMH